MNVDYLGLTILTIPFKFLSAFFFRGHTWQDMADSDKSMAWPWSVLRCLHLWKPRDRAWGYDLLTAAALRIGNQQLGCEPYDLRRFVNQVMVPLGSPAFLNGSIDLDNDLAWLIYLGETISNYFSFLQTVNIAGHALAIVLLGLVTGVVHFRKGDGFSVARKGLIGILLTHCLVIAVAALLLHAVHSSKWAKDIASGKTLMRPFPNPEEASTLTDPGVSDGLSIVPSRVDVLVGSRFD